MSIEPQNLTAKIALEQNGARLECSGNWVSGKIEPIAKLLDYLKYASGTDIVIDAKQIVNMDTIGAWVLNDLIKQLLQKPRKITLIGLNPEHELLYKLVATNADEIKPPPPPPKHNLFYYIGAAVVEKFSHAVAFTTFLGELTVEIFNNFFKPKNIQWQGFWNVIDAAGYRALPIIALLLFLIGLVLSYEMGLQLKVYGANIYIVSLSGIAIVQEFGPLITAIIVDGRTGSAFTAQLGSMKINQEVDALRTMGISPMNRLALPRFFGLIVALPLLTIWADVFGIMGAMFMAKHYLGMSYYDYLSRFPHDVRTFNYVIGMCKAPVFAAIIAAVGCFQGFDVGYSAESVGQKTTQSVVQSIFLIIIADALFSIVFGW